MADPGEGPGGAEPPLFLDQTEARRAEKDFFRPPPPLPLSEGLDQPLPGEWNAKNFTLENSGESVR